MSSIISISDIAREHEETCRERYRNSVLGVYRANRNNRAEFEGTGFLVRAGGRILLITARHVLRDTPKESYFLGTTTCLIPIEGDFYFATDHIRHQSPESDIWDLAIWEIPQEFHGACYDHTVLEETDLHSGILGSRKHLFSLTGCPASKNKLKHSDHKNRKLLLTAWTFACIAKQFPAEWIDRGASPDSHLALKFDPKCFVDAAGAKSSPPALPGMSGGLITCCPSDARSLGDSNWTDRTKVIGVFLEYQKSSGTLLAVKISPVLEDLKNLHFS